MRCAVSPSIGRHRGVLNQREIEKLVPAFPRDCFLGVGRTADGWHVWGFADGRERGDTITVEIVGPGMLRVDVGLYRPFAILMGRSNHVLHATRTDIAHRLQRILKKSISTTSDFLEANAIWQESVAFAELVRLIRADGHGGTVLIVPSETGDWASALEFAYRLRVPNPTIRDDIRHELEDSKELGNLLVELSGVPMEESLKSRLQVALAQRLRRPSTGSRAAASLAGVDGAVVMTRDTRILGFGAKIAVKRKIAVTQETEPEIRIHELRPEGSEVLSVVQSSLEALGGTRHQSAARFVSAHTDAAAVVVSQDGPVSLMHWDEEFKTLIVHRNADWFL